MKHEETIKNTIGFFIAIGIVLLAVASCETTEHSSGGEIDAVYWHEHSSYTVMVNNADVITKHRLPPFNHSRSGAVRLYTDVADGDKSWYECEWTRNEWTGADPDVSFCNIHIHALDELGSADWNHGKFGSGSTTRID